MFLRYRTKGQSVVRNLIALCMFFYGSERTHVYCSVHALVVLDESMEGVRRSNSGKPFQKKKNISKLVLPMNKKVGVTIVLKRLGCCMRMHADLLSHYALVLIFLPLGFATACLTHWW